MADPNGQDPVADDPDELEKLRTEIAELRQSVFIGESIIEELRQALSASQVAQAKANALLKLANQPTA